MQWLTKRWAIDALHREDAEALLRYRADTEVSRYQSWQPSSINDALQFIETCETVELDAPGTWFSASSSARFGHPDG